MTRLDPARLIWLAGGLVSLGCGVAGAALPLRFGDILEQRMEQS